MERIVYRKTLDVHKNGVQFLLQGFETADKLSRVIEISLMASGDAIDLPLESLVAMMYVTTPNATEPSINKCTIKDNKIIYEVLPITEEGITEMRLKLIETGPNGASSVLASPKFSVEVTESGMNDDGEELNQKFAATALEDFIAKAETAYWKRCERIELDNDCMFKAYYADGTYYETDILKELFVEGNVKLSQSYAKGGTGTRAGEDTDNSMYYSNVSRSEAQNAKAIMENSEELLDEVRKHGLYTTFSIDFTTGEVVYASPSYKFNVNIETGELDAEGIKHTFNDYAGKYFEYWLAVNGIVISDLKNSVSTNEADIAELKEKVIPVEHVYTKEETASERTLGLFGLSADNSPNDIFKMLGSHWWRRRTVEEGYALDTGTLADGKFTYDSATERYRIYYSDSYTIENGKISLVEYKNLSFSKLDLDKTTRYYEFEELKGKYFQILYYIEKGKQNGQYIEYDSCVFKSNSDNVVFYRDNNGFLVPQDTMCYKAKYYVINGEFEYMYSHNQDEFPTGVVDGFEYEYLGVPYVNAVLATTKEK